MRYPVLIAIVIVIVAAIVQTPSDPHAGGKKMETHIDIITHFMLDRRSCSLPLEAAIAVPRTRACMNQPRGAAAAVPAAIAADGRMICCFHIFGSSGFYLTCAIVGWPPEDNESVSDSYTHKKTPPIKIH